MAATMKDSLRERCKVVVCAETVRRAAQFSAVMDVRYYLNGVAVSPAKSGGVNVMASDGHVAIVLHDPNGKADAPVILPFNRKAHARALSMRGAAYVAVQAQQADGALGDARISVADWSGRELFVSPDTLITGRFPDIAAPLGKIGDYKPGLQGTINPEFLQRAIESRPAKSSCHGVAFFSKGSNGERHPTLFTTPGGFGLLMPMVDSRPLSSRIPKDFGGSL